MNFAIMGLGGRGSAYAHFARYFGRDVVAVCDSNPAKLDLAMEYGVKRENFYTDEDEFFAKGKLADALVIATLDDLHYGQTMRALEVGYDILLEKPIALTLEECESIRDKAVELGRKVVICHVLRYTPLYTKMKELLDSGAIGDIVCLDVTEDIGYYHYAHSFCRGNWRNTDVGAPLILAKNCHDTDAICWLVGKKCLAVSSFGSLKYFKEEYAPEGSTSHCYTCPHKDSCKYSGFRIYKNDEYERLAALAKHGNLGSTHEEIDKSLHNPDNLLARCVYRCDNNVVDNQIVNMQFEDGISAQLKSIAFTNDMHRVIKIYGTNGIMYNALDGERAVVVENLEREPERHYYGEPEGGYENHGGGDVSITREFIDYIERGVMTKSITDIKDSVMGHKVAFLAEKSKNDGGKLYHL